MKIVADARPEPSGPHVTNQTARDLDQAFWYVQESSIGDDGYLSSASDMKALRRKIDWHIVPIMFCCYTMQFIDKVLLNVSRPIIRSPVEFVLTRNQYAAVMGLNRDLKLRGDDFTNAATAFFIAYLVAEVPNGNSPMSLYPLPFQINVYPNPITKASSFRNSPPQDGSPPMSFSGASRLPAPPQPTTTAPCSPRASSSESSKPPSPPRRC